MSKKLNIQTPEKFIEFFETANKEQLDEINEFIKEAKDLSNKK